jgi:hypothetical protein
VRHLSRPGCDQCSCRVCQTQPPNSGALRGIGCFEVIQREAFAVLVAGLPEDRGSFLVSADRVPEPARFSQGQAEAVQRGALTVPVAGLMEDGDGVLARGNRVPNRPAPRRARPRLFSTMPSPCRSPVSRQMVMRSWSAAIASSNLRSSCRALPRLFSARPSRAEIGALGAVPKLLMRDGEGAVGRRRDGGKPLPAFKPDTWDDLIQQALEIPGSLAEFLSRDLSLTIPGESPAILAVRLDTATDLGELVDVTGLEPLPGVRRRRQAIGYFLSSQDGSWLPDAAKRMVTDVLRYGSCDCQR